MDLLASCKVLTLHVPYLVLMHTCHLSLCNFSCLKMIWLFSFAHIIECSAIDSIELVEMSNEHLVLIICIYGSYVEL